MIGTTPRVIKVPKGAVFIRVNILLHEVRKTFLRKGLGLDRYYVKKTSSQVLE